MIGSAQQPVYVPVRPEPNAPAKYCFPNVEAKVAQDGGETVIGWTIWETPGLLVEGEFHSCWRSPGGELIDITEKPDGEERILFVPDPSRRWDRKFVGNIRLALSDSAYVRQLIAENERLEKLKLKYWCGDRAEIPMDELYGGALTSDALAVVKRPGRNEPCHCGSGKKYKRCHGPLDR